MWEEVPNKVDCSETEKGLIAVIGEALEGRE
jgi:hypothetical protein